MELLAPLAIPFQRYPTTLVLTAAEKAHAREVLSGHRMSFQKPVVILHPGSGGSSERWPLSHFMALGDRLQAEGYDASCGHRGTGHESVQSVMIDQMHRIPVFIPAGSVSLRSLAALLSQAQLVVTNSTGPLHMAVALDVPTVSMYSPIPTCHPRRWGPYPDYAESGSASCGSCGAGNGPAIMWRWTRYPVDQVWAQCTKLLGSVASGEKR